jgi:hypothetical protein
MGCHPSVGFGRQLRMPCQKNKQSWEFIRKALDLDRPSGMNKVMAVSGSWLRYTANTELSKILLKLILKKQV